MAIPIPRDARQLLDPPNYVHLSILRADGSPRNWVVWVGLEDDYILVQRTVRGRNHWLSLQPGSLDSAQRWIGEQAASWSSRADALAARLERKRPGA